MASEGNHSGQQVDSGEAAGEGGIAARLALKHRTRTEDQIEASYAFQAEQKSQG
jgi:hypothetical protein